MTENQTTLYTCYAISVYSKSGCGFGNPKGKQQLLGTPKKDTPMSHERSIATSLAPYQRLLDCCILQALAMSRTNMQLAKAVSFFYLKKRTLGQICFLRWWEICCKFSGCFTLSTMAIAVSLTCMCHDTWVSGQLRALLNSICLQAYGTVSRILERNFKQQAALYMYKYAGPCVKKNTSIHSTWQFVVEVTP